MIVVASHDRIDFLSNILNQLSNINLNNHSVLIVDTNSSNKEYREFFTLQKDIYKNFHFVSMIETTWDSGAYIFGFKNFNEKNFIFLQDSVSLSNPNIFVEFDSRLEDNDVVAFLNFIYFYENDSQRDFVQKDVEVTSLPKDAFFGPIFAAKKSILEKIPAYWLNIPKNKNEGCGYERKWALIFHLLNAKVDWLERDLVSAACSQKFLDKKFLNRP